MSPFSPPNCEKLLNYVLVGVPEPEPETQIIYLCKMNKKRVRPHCRAPVLVPLSRITLTVAPVVTVRGRTRGLGVLAPCVCVCVSMKHALVANERAQQSRHGGKMKGSGKMWGEK